MRRALTLLNIISFLMPLLNASCCVPSVSVPDERLEVLGGDACALLFIVSSTDHGLLYDVSDFLSCLTEHLVHVLRHRVVGAKVLMSRLCGLGVRVQRCLILLEELLLDSNVVVGDAEHGEAVLGLLDIRTLARHLVL